MEQVKIFSNWISWERRNTLEKNKSPGVYAIACSETEIKGEYQCRKEIIYFGMTNSKGGLKSRLQQFDNTINPGGKGHGGARRVIFKHKSPEVLRKNLYVAICAFECDVTSQSEKDLRIMGKIAELEFICFAEYVKKFGELPEFNDKKRSPKK